MRKLLSILLPLALALGGCAALESREEGPRRYEATFLELFDTVTTVIGYADSDAEKELTEYRLTIPRTDDLLAPALAVIPAQLFAYYCAIQRGYDPDKPRNLAKSVTVE